MIVVEQDTNAIASEEVINEPSLDEIEKELKLGTISVNRKLVTFRLLALISVGIAVAGGLFLSVLFKQFFEWDSTLEEFRTSAVKEKEAFDVQLAELTAKEEEKVAVIKDEFN